MGFYAVVYCFYFQNLMFVFIFKKYLCQPFRFQMYDELISVLKSESSFIVNFEKGQKHFLD